jgi:hypothetical protein
VQPEQTIALALAGFGDRRERLHGFRLAVEQRIDPAQQEPGLQGRELVVRKTTGRTAGPAQRANLRRQRREFAPALPRPRRNGDAAPGELVTLGRGECADRAREQFEQGVGRPGSAASS